MQRKISATALRDNWEKRRSQCVWKGFHNILGSKEFSGSYYKRISAVVFEFVIQKSHNKWFEYFVETKHALSLLSGILNFPNAFSCHLNSWKQIPIPKFQIPNFICWSPPAIPTSQGSLLLMKKVFLLLSSIQRRHNWSKWKYLQQ